MMRYVLAHVRRSQCPLLSKTRAARTQKNHLFFSYNINEAIHEVKLRADQAAAGSEHLLISHIFFKCC